MTNGDSFGKRMLMQPTLWLRLEGLAMFVATVALYAHLQLNGWLFLLLLLVPDIAMIGYLRNPQFGALIYNLAHNYALAFGLIGLALAAQWTVGVMLGLIWVAHISMDRALGYGLKYDSAFKDTHLGSIGA
jgi:hypothetical protein